MKKILLALALLMLVGAAASAQQCARDSSILQMPDVFVLPQLYNPTSHPTIDTKPACINEPYSQSVTIKIAETIVVFGTPVPLDSVVAAATGAIQNLPAGLTYSCDPPNCVFKKNTLGCTLIYGTPAASNTPGQKVLNFKVKAYTALLPTPIDVDLSLLQTGSQFIIDVRNPGECTVSAQELAGQIASVKNAPNPFSGLTQIMVESLVSGAFQFEVRDVLGQRVHAEKINLVEGQNALQFDAGDLEAGTYFYSISNPDGQITKLMTIAK